MVKWIILAVLLLPLLEIAVFVLVAAQAGFLWALGLSLATSAAGFLLLQAGGRGGLARVRAAAATDEAAAVEALAGGALTVVAGVLLLLPGFLTDLAGALLLLPPVRRRFGARVLRAAGGAPGRRRDGVIDLEAGEWRQVPDPELEDRTRKDPPPPPRAGK